MDAPRTRHFLSESESAQRSIVFGVTMSAARVLQKRAVQCSFSSVFHLRKAGMEGRQAKQVENVFIGVVAVPLAFMGLGGVWFSAVDRA